MMLPSGLWTGVRAVISAAHRDQERGHTHGHSYEVKAWFPYDEGSVLAFEARLCEVADLFDHTTLPDSLAWAEPLARHIGESLDDMGCVAVEISRPLEGFYALWVA